MYRVMGNILASQVLKYPRLTAFIGVAVLLLSIRTGAEAYKCNQKLSTWEIHVTAHLREIKSQIALRSRKAALIANSPEYGCNKSASASYQEIITQCPWQYALFGQEMETALLLGADQRVQQLESELIVLRKTKPLFVNLTCSK